MTSRTVLAAQVLATRQAVIPRKTGAPSDTIENARTAGVWTLLKITEWGHHEPKAHLNHDHGVKSSPCHGYSYLPFIFSSLFAGRIFRQLFYFLSFQFPSIFVYVYDLCPLTMCSFHNSKVLRNTRCFWIYISFWLTIHRSFSEGRTQRANLALLYQFKQLEPNHVKHRKLLSGWCLVTEPG